MKCKFVVFNITLLAAIFTLVAPTLAQTGRMGPGRGYATDSFEGFDTLDEDTRIAQKEPSFWRAKPRETTPEAQLHYARERENAERNRKARKAYDALVRKWPTAPEAAQAQLELAKLLEKQKRFERAFDEYQYLLTHYAGNCPYQEVLDRQYRIANHLFHNNRSMFGWRLSGYDTIRGRFEQIVRNAPRGPLAPELMLIIGGIRVSEKELVEAIAVYEGLLNRFPQSPQAPDAAYLAAQCRYDLAVKHSYNESNCREGIAFIKSAMTRMPTHPQREQLAEWLETLTALLIEQNFLQAVFYDTRQRNVEAAKSAYRRFLAEFSDSKYAAQVRQRLDELEHGAAPLK